MSLLDILIFSKPIPQGIKKNKIIARLECNGNFFDSLSICLNLPDDIVIKKRATIIGYSNSVLNIIGEMKLTKIPPSQPPIDIIR